MSNEYIIERYLRTRPRGIWITISSLVRVLKISKSSASKILQGLTDDKYVLAERVLTNGRGQPTLAYRWNHARVADAADL